MPFAPKPVRQFRISLADVTLQGMAAQPFIRSKITEGTGGLLGCCDTQGYGGEKYGERRQAAPRARVHRQDSDRGPDPCQARGR